MASLTKKIISGRAYYYLRETAWVEGRSRVVRTKYLGRVEDIERRLEQTTEPKAVVVRSFGAVAATLKVATERVQIDLLDACEVHRDVADVAREPDATAVGGHVELLAGV